MVVAMMKIMMTERNSGDNDDVALQLPAEDEVLLQKLREESRAVFLQRKSRELLDNEELQVKLPKRSHDGVLLHG